MAHILPPLRQMQVAASSSMRDSYPTPPPIRSTNTQSHPRQLKLPSIRSLDLLPIDVQARATGSSNQPPKATAVSVSTSKDAHDSLLESPNEDVKPQNLTVPTMDNYGLDHRAPHNMRRAYGVSRHLSVSSCASDAMSIDYNPPEGDEGYDSAVSHGSGMAYSAAPITSAYSSRPLTPPDEYAKPSAGKLSSLINKDLPDSLSILSEAANASSHSARGDARYETERRRAGTIDSAFREIKGQDHYRYRDIDPYTPRDRYRQQSAHSDPAQQARFRSLSDQDSRRCGPRETTYQRAVSPRSYMQRRPSPGGANVMPSVLQKPHHRSQPYPPSHRPIQQRPSYPTQAQPIYERHDKVVQLKAFPDFDRSLIYRASAPQGSQTRPPPPNPPKLQLPDLSKQKRSSQESPMSGVSQHSIPKPAKQPGTIALHSIDDAEMPTIERPFSCPGCDRTFTRRYDRNRHARKHTGEKPYPCGNPACSEGYGRPDALQRHYRSHPECERFRNNTRRSSLSSSSEGEPRDSFDRMTED